MSRRASWAHAAAFAVLSLLLGWSLFAVPYLPTNDGPEHVLATHIEAHYGDPGSIYAEELVPAPAYAARGFALLYGPLAEALGWRVGLQVALVLIALATAWGFVAVVRAVAPRRLAVAFLGFPLALTWELYMGFFPFAVGSALGLFVLALAIGWRPPSRLQRGLLAFFLLVQAVCHVFTAVLTGIALAVVLVARAPRGQRLAELARVASMGLPASWVLFASIALGGSLTKSPFSEKYVVLPASMTLAILPRLVAPGPNGRALAVAALLAVAVVVAGRRCFTARDPSADDRSLLVVGMTLLLLTALCPLNIPGWQFFSPRFAPLGALLCLAAFPVERSGESRGDRVGHRWNERAREALAVAVPTVLFLASAASLVASFGLHARLARAAGDAIAGLTAPVARHGFWLPITLAPQGTLPFDPTRSEVPFLAPLRHGPSLYAAVQGGLTPYTFANNAATYPFVLRPDGRHAPPTPREEKYGPLVESDRFDADPRFRAHVENELATYGMFYEGVLVTGALPLDLALWHERGFATDWANASVLLAHFVPCALDVVMAGSREAPLVDVGVADQTILRDERPEASVDADGSRHLRVARAPCGAVWVRPHGPALGDGAAGYCRNARPGGEVDATLTWSNATVRCDAP